jgi:hypothetical protein
MTSQKDQQPAFLARSQRSPLASSARCMIDFGIMELLSLLALTLGFRLPVAIAIGHTEPGVVLEYLQATG